jgi:hypothetical protein
MRIYRDDRMFASAGKIFDIPFLQDTERRLKAVYLPDWNEREGFFEVQLFYGDKQLITEDKMRFALKRRPLAAMKDGLMVVDLETNRSVRDTAFTNPEGKKTDYSALLQWAQFMKADALWLLAGETTTFSGRNADESPWDNGPLENLYLLKEKADDYGMQVGAYIMCFYVPGPHGVPFPYEAGLGYNSEDDYLYPSKHISLNSEQRLVDIINLAKQFQKDPEIDYIGFDFIRTGRVDGYELVSEVVKETNIRKPEHWEYLSNEDKIIWFARKIEVEKDPVIIEKWRWWRAHKVAEIVKRVIEEAQVTKPVWVYTLGWNHGKEHGQDPVMFFDAGVAIDAVMLYEANSAQFERLLNHWKRYINADEGNIIVGNCIDYKLLDSEVFSPPQELFRRNIEGYRNIMNNGFASGLFIHDLARAFWGRKGGYSIKDYALSFISSIYSFYKDLQIMDLVVDIIVEDYAEFLNDTGVINGHVFLQNKHTEDLKDVQLEIISPKHRGITTLYYQETYHFADNIKIEKIGTREKIRLDFNIVMENIDLEYIGFKVALDGNREYYIKKLLDFQKSKSMAKK